MTLAYAILSFIATALSVLETCSSDQKSKTRSSGATGGKRSLISVTWKKKPLETMIHAPEPLKLGAVSVAPALQFADEAPRPNPKPQFPCGAHKVAIQKKIPVYRTYVHPTPGGRALATLFRDLSGRLLCSLPSSAVGERPPPACPVSSLSRICTRHKTPTGRSLGFTGATSRERASVCTPAHLRESQASLRRQQPPWPHAT